jgi:tetratricopeptide (TPR) repeat protein
MSPPFRCLAALAVAAGLGACGAGAEEPGVHAAPGAVRARPLRPSRDPELAEVRRVIEGRRGDLALTLLERVSGVEPECLRARAECLRGDAVAALAALERARLFDSFHPELLATEIEIFAALDRVASALELLEQGFRRCGAEPALLRARGVVDLRRAGRGASALEALERAHALDPELPFLRRPLAQAHLLVGRSRLEQAPAEATAHARSARRIWPGDDGPEDEELEAETLELEAEGLAGELRLEEAIACLEELEARGQDLGPRLALLHQRCATFRLLERDRDGAVEHYLAARGLGLDDEELGFGAEVLAEERRAALGRGRAAFDARDWGSAEREFARALELQPGDPESENHLAAARFARADFRGAAEGWERALVRARERGVALADPIPLDLARAWRLAGERERAREVLAGYLDREPEGPWSGEARELLLALEAESLAAE